MASPFPGMDPYLEDPGLWPDLHQRIITYIADTLQPRVRPRYHARIGERLYVVSVPHIIYPDITPIRRPVSETTPAVMRSATTGEVSVVEVDSPWAVTVPPVEYREPFVEIVHSAGGEVVTVLEVLSPSNKAPGEGHRLYRQKQAEIMGSQAHLVEIDLLGQGMPTIALPEVGFEKLPPYRYLVGVSRAPDREKFEMYPAVLEKRLPRFGIPLREPDPDVALDLQAIFARCYENGGYADFIDYRKPPPVELSKEEQAWVENLLKEKSVRVKRKA
jgi:hypothetical protein